MSILEDLYYGKIFPCERPAKKGTEHYELRRKIIEYEEKLREHLSEEDFEIVQKLVETVGWSCKINSINDFKTGFSLGAGMLYECMEEREEYIK